MRYSALLAASLIFSSCAIIQKQTDDRADERIVHILEVLAFQKVDDHDGMKISGCFPGDQSWVQAALLKKEIDLQFNFSETCDLSGKFKASYLDKIPMQLKVRNLEEFTTAKLLVKLNIRQTRNGMIYGFNVADAVLSSPKETLNFAAKYKVTADPLTNEVIQDTEQGIVQMKKVNGKIVNTAKPFKLD